MAALPVAFALTSSMATASVVSERGHDAPTSVKLPALPAFADPAFSASGLRNGAFLSAERRASAARMAGSPEEAVELELVLPTLAATGPSMAERWAHFGETFGPTHERRRTAPALRNDVLGSVALAISQVPQSRRWHDLLEERADSYFADSCSGDRSVCTGKLRGRLAEAVATARGQDDRDAIDTVNAAVNAGLKYRRDLDGYGVADYWATAKETLARGSGDCEEFATLKMWMLLAAGFDRSQLRLQLVKLLKTGEDHAILVVDTGASRLVLDNLSAVVRDDGEVNEYRPLLSFVGGDAFLHGFKSTPAKSNEIAALR
jgi:predicted transglutaminase-like cysteine proteinase